MLWQDTVINQEWLHVLDLCSRFTALGPQSYTHRRHELSGYLGRLNKVPQFANLAFYRLLLNWQSASARTPTISKIIWGESNHILYIYG